MASLRASWSMSGVGSRSCNTPLSIILVFAMFSIGQSFSSMHSHAALICSHSLSLSLPPSRSFFLSPGLGALSLPVSLSLSLSLSLPGQERRANPTPPRADAHLSLSLSLPGEEPPLSLSLSLSLSVSFFLGRASRCVFVSLVFLSAFSAPA